jgi:chemotaxis protein methyltransferase CheR
MGLYPLTWADKIAPELRHKYCLKGKGKYEGEFLIDRQLAKNVRFMNNNLLDANISFGHFNIVFLRNVLIYFNDETRERVINNITHNMQSGSYLIISQTENLNSLHVPQLEQVRASIYKVK